MEILLLKQAQKSIKALDTVSRKRVKDAVFKLPEGDVKKLQGYTDLFRLRIGNLRVLFRIDGNRIYIEDVLPRGEAYKRL